MISAKPDDHSAFLDDVYRRQRHVYDPLRRTFLFGRDRLIERLASEPAATRSAGGAQINAHGGGGAQMKNLLEVGCGTARNLIKLHRRLPGARLYGLDASAEMLKTARAKLERRGLTRHIELRRGLAEELDHGQTFGLDQPFDAVFFAYSLTMMPAWRQAIDAALANLRPGGGLYAVDFWDQASWPAWLRSTLQARLARYRVRYHPEMLAYLRRLESREPGVLHLESVFHHYAFFATFTPR